MGFTKVVITATVITLSALCGHGHHHHITVREAPYCTVSRTQVVTCIGLGR